MHHRIQILLTFCVLLVGCELEGLHGPSAVGVEIIVTKDVHGNPLQPGDELFLHEIPTATGFLEARYSRLYRGALPPPATIGNEQYGAVELMGSIPVGWPARQWPDPLSGGFYGEITIQRLGGRLYENLWWMLIAGTDYRAVVFDPYPGQPAPPTGMPVTTWLNVCQTDEVHSSLCRSWPGAVDSGMVVCRDAYTKIPISKGKCKLLAPYTQWYVVGTPPQVPRPVRGLYAVGMDDVTFQAEMDEAIAKHEQLIQRVREDAEASWAMEDPEARREAEEWAAQFRREAGDPYGPSSSSGKSWDSKWLPMIFSNLCPYRALDSH